MQIQKNISLKKFNTFGIDVRASTFVEVDTINELRDVLSENKSKPKFVLGGGSNLLLTKDMDTLVIHVRMKGRRLLREDADHVWVEGEAGENWHEFVLWNIDQNFGGLENMSLIPGNLGTAPVQNIGAYGSELKDNFVYCEAIDMENLETKTFTKDECHFNYRESVFKHEAKGRYIITSVTFKLSKRNHNINTAYGDIQAELLRKEIAAPSLKDVSNAIINIRKNKLPDPKVLGNCGSFFKNPVIPKATFEMVQQKFPDIKHFAVSDCEVKVPAGWLIEKAGFKGKRIGNTGVHKDQALVLVNYGGATGSEVVALATHIQSTVMAIFGISIDMEVNVI